MTPSSPLLLLALVFATATTVFASPGATQASKSAAQLQDPWKTIAYCKYESCWIVIWEAATDRLLCRYPGTEVGMVFLEVPVKDADRGRTILSKIAEHIGLYLMPTPVAGVSPRFNFGGLISRTDVPRAFRFPRCWSASHSPSFDRETYGDWCLHNFVDPPAAAVIPPDLWFVPVIEGASDRIVQGLDPPEAADVLTRVGVKGESVEPKTLSGAVALIYLNRSGVVPFSKDRATVADAVLKRVVDGKVPGESDDLTRGIALLALAKDETNLRQRIRLLRRAARLSTSSTRFLDLEATLRICYSLLGLGRTKEARAEALSGITRCSDLQTYFSHVLLRAMAKDPRLFSKTIGICNGWGNDLYGPPLPPETAY